MKNIARILFFLFCSVVLTGCAGGVLSKNLVGLEDYRLDPKKIDGTWIGDGGALLLKTVDRDKGILKVIVLEDPGDAFSLKEGPMEIKIMKGKEWLYFTILSPRDDTVPPGNVKPDGSENAYLWGRVVINDRSIVYWLPSMGPFVQAIEQKMLAGILEQKVNDDGTSRASSVLITDTPKNLITLIETYDRTYFDWDDPVFLLKVTK
jgi:hypothetical protein